MVGNEDAKAPRGLPGPRLVVVGGGRVGGCVQLTIGEPLTLGRAEQLLGDESLSREHVEIIATHADRARLRDLGSTSGTFVNGSEVTTAEVGPGDRVQLGRGTVLRLAPAEDGASNLVDTYSEHRTSRVEPTQPGVQSRHGWGEGPHVVGGSAALLATMGLAEQVAQTNSSVLIMGETGTGKELVARAIHAASSRRNEPFVAVDLPSIPPTLLEGALFGHVKGAYTGAHRDSPGLIEAARGGTLFLDEIGDLAIELQSRLLRLVQERTYRQVGGSRPVEADFRLISATLHDLDAQVQQGKFREDLLYRIDVVRIVTPPLRERPGDIEVLARSFLARYCGRDGRETLKLSDHALDELREYHWPGNVRELEHTMERAAALTPDGQEVGKGLVNWRTARSTLSAIVDEEYSLNRGLDALLADVEKRILADAMSRLGGNRTAVATKLGIPRTTLRNKLKKHGLG